MLFSLYEYRFLDGATGDRGRLDVRSRSRDRPVVRERTDKGTRRRPAHGRRRDRVTHDGNRERGIDRKRKERVLEAADRRRAEQVGEEVTFIANLNNNVTTACNVGCLFCNFKDAAHTFERETEIETAGFTKTPAESREIVADAVDRGILRGYVGLRASPCVRARRGTPGDPQRPPEPEGSQLQAPELYDTDPHLHRPDFGDERRRGARSLDDARGGLPPAAVPTGPTRRSTGGCRRRAWIPFPEPQRKSSSRRSAT